MLQVTTTFPIFRPLAEHSLLVEYGDTIDAAIHAQVLDLDHALMSQPFEGFVEAVPAYATLLVRFDPLHTDHAIVEQALRQLMTEGPPRTAQGSPREVDVCYDSDLAPDLDEVAKLAGLDREAVIKAHLAGDYSVYLYGFAPGYAYMAGVPAELRIPRKPTAVRDIPAGSVLIAGAQCLVSTLTMPTGWWIIGRSPTPILTRHPDRPFLFDVGDLVRFRRITRQQFEEASQ